MLIMKFCYYGSNFRQKFQAVLEYAFRECDENIPILPPPFSKDEALKNVEHSMSIRNLIFGFNSVSVSYLIPYDSLLQNTTDVITKCDSYFITKWDSYYKMGQFYNKMRQILQSAIFIKNCNSTTTYLTCYSKTVLETQITIHPTKTNFLEIFT